MNTRDVQKSLGTFGMGSKRSGSVNLALSKNDNLRPEKLSGNVSEDVMCGALEASWFESGIVAVTK